MAVLLCKRIYVIIILTSELFLALLFSWSADCAPRVCTAWKKIKPCGFFVEETDPQDKKCSWTAEQAGPPSAQGHLHSLYTVNQIEARSLTPTYWNGAT